MGRPILFSRARGVLKRDTVTSSCLPMDSALSKRDKAEKSGSDIARWLAEFAAGVFALNLARLIDDVLILCHLV